VLPNAPGKATAGSLLHNSFMTVELVKCFCRSQNLTWAFPSIKTKTTSFSFCLWNLANSKISSLLRGASAAPARRQ
jgi:hypothetical protein